MRFRFSAFLSRPTVQAFWLSPSPTRAIADRTLSSVFTAIACATAVKTRGLRALQPDGACHTRPAEAAVPVGILREVLLVIRLGVVEGACGRDLGRDLAVSRFRELGLE